MTNLKNELRPVGAAPVRHWRQKMKVILAIPHDAPEEFYPHVWRSDLTECSAPRELLHAWALGGEHFFFWIADAVLSFDT